MQNYYLKNASDCETNILNSTTLNLVLGTLSKCLEEFSVKINTTNKTNIFCSNGKKVEIIFVDRKHAHLINTCSGSPNHLYFYLCSKHYNNSKVTVEPAQEEDPEYSGIFDYSWVFACVVTIGTILGWFYYCSWKGEQNVS